jgi:hypothetical protein
MRPPSVSGLKRDTVFPLVYSPRCPGPGFPAGGLFPEGPGLASVESEAKIVTIVYSVNMKSVSTSKITFYTVLLQ